MVRFFKSFRDSDAGDTTVDWIALTAAAVALSSTTYTTIESGAATLTASTLAHIVDQAPATDKN